MSILCQSMLQTTCTAIPKIPSDGRKRQNLVSRWTTLKENVLIIFWIVTENVFTFGVPMKFEILRLKLPRTWRSGYDTTSCQFSKSNLCYCTWTYSWAFFSSFGSWDGGYWAHYDMLLSTTLKANETGVHPWRSMDTRVFPPPSKIAPCRNMRSVRQGARSSVRKKSRPPAVRAGHAVWEGGHAGWFPGPGAGDPPVLAAHRRLRETARQEPRQAEVVVPGRPHHR